MAGGVPRLDRLVSTVGDLVGRSSGRRVRAYGEMVALLWQRGDVAEAIALEGLWNDLARELDLDLLCSYSVEALGTSDLHQLQQMCREHSAFVTPDASSPTTEEHVAGARSRSRVFLPAPQAVSATRRFVADVLADWGQAPLVEDGVLIASELATNAVVHGGSPFRTSVRVQDDSVLIEVEDAHAGTPQRGPARLEGLDGRGIAIVEDLSHRSGCTRLPDSKVLWAELAAC
jgi:anti-sigma regulatory factor (Ser/Thr protein kinase)